MNDYTFNSAHKDVKEHAASGFVFSGLSQGTRILTQFISVLVMARLLDPSDFGLVAKVSPVYAFAVLFHDVGLSQATLQRPSLTLEHVNSFFWINIACAVLMAAGLIFVSPMVGWFYHDPRTVPLTMAMALLVIVVGAGNQHGAIMVRQMMFREQAIINMAASIGGLIAVITWGVIFKNYWALYVSMVVNSFLPTVGAWLSVKWRPRLPSFTFAPQTGEMLRYGLGFTTGNFINFLIQNINNVVIGRVLGDWLLGVYDRASRLFSAPLQQLMVPVSGVVVPILYRLNHDEARYRRIFLRTVGSLTLAILPGVVWVIVASDVVVSTLLGQKWHAATPVFAALSLAALPQLINSASNWLIMTQGKSQDYARWSLISGLTSIAALFAGLRFGIIGVAYASVIVQFLRTPLNWWFACRTGPVAARKVFDTLVPPVIGGIGAAPILLALRTLWGTSYPVPLLILGGLLSYIVVVAIVALFPLGRIALKQDIEFAKLILTRFFRKAESQDQTARE